jgi:hypothetical protein
LRSINNKSFCDIDLHSSLNKNVFQYAGLTYYSTIGLALTQADFKYFFTLHHRKCPFEKGGQYLLCLPNHAMGLSVDNKGKFEFYDPNLGKPLKDPLQLTLDLLFNYYACKNIFLISIYAIKPLIAQRIYAHDDYVASTEPTYLIGTEDNIIARMNKCAVSFCKYYEHMNFEYLLEMGIAQIMLYNTDCYTRAFFERKLLETDVLNGHLFNKKYSNNMTILYHALIAAFRINDTNYVEMLLKTNSIDVNDVGHAAHPIELLIFYNEPGLATLLLTKEEMTVELGVHALTYLDRRIKFKEYDFIDLLFNRLGRSVFFESPSQPF